MANRKLQIKRKRRKSIFCQKKPSSYLVIGAVFLKDDPNPTWVPCRGKLYKNGYFRYLYNGKEGTIGPRYYRYYPGITDEQLTEQIKTLNLQNLKNRNPQINQQKNWLNIVDDYYYNIPELPLEPVVMTDDNLPDQMIPVIDATMPPGPAETTPTAIFVENVDQTIIDIIYPPGTDRPRRIAEAETLIRNRLGIPRRRRNE